MEKTHKHDSRAHSLVTMEAQVKYTYCWVDTHSCTKPNWLQRLWEPGGRHLTAIGYEAVQPVSSPRSQSAAPAWAVQPQLLGRNLVVSKSRRSSLRNTKQNSFLFPWSKYFMISRRSTWNCLPLHRQSSTQAIGGVLLRCW